MARMDLRCKNNRKKGLWLLAKKKDTYAWAMHEDYLNEAEYINALSDSEKEWLNTFLQGHYHRDKKSMVSLNFSPAYRKDRYNQHRGAVEDISTKRKNIVSSPALWSLSQIDKEYDNLSNEDKPEILRPKTGRKRKQK